MQLESLPGWSWDPFADAWDTNFQQLQAYLKKHKTYPGTASKYLQKWGVKQRVAYKKKNLSRDRIRRLESLPGWSWDLLTDGWNTNFQQLQAYVKKHQAYPSQISGPLGVWLNRQRTAYKKKTLSTDRIRRLESLPGWSWYPKKTNENKTDIKFRESLSLTEKIIRKNKCLPRRNATDPLEIKAYNFLNSVRQRKKQGIMSQHRIKTIDKAIPGFSWEPLLDKKDKPMDALLVFMRENQRLPSVRSSNPKEITLANLMYMIRQRKKRGELTSDQISKLNKFPFWLWSGRDRS